MIEGMEKLLPPGEFAAFQNALNSFPNRAIRLRIDRRVDDIPFSIEPVPWLPSGYWVSDREVRPGGVLAYAAADFYIQDAASFLPIRLADIQPSDRVCDLCAAPGGKATAIAERLGPEGGLLANETIQSRLDVLRYNLARTGRANYAISQQDPDDLSLRCTDLFNKLIVDVPCSGQSLLSRGKHDMSAFRPQHIEHCAARARRILLAAARMLEFGGLLVFSTCTFSIEENESQVEWLMGQYPGVWEPSPVKELELWRSPLSEGCYRLWPHRDRCSGGFAACLRKVSEMPERESPIDPLGTRSLELAKDQHTGRRIPTSKGRPTAHRESSELRELLASIGEWHYEPRVDGTSAMIQEPGLQRLAECVEQQDGIQFPKVASMIRHHTEPMHVLAMANPSIFRPFREISLSDAEAACYVAGNALSNADRSSKSATAWVRAVWHGKPLGWLKESSHRWNNHLPAWARVKIDS